jgi:hypothetical protein
MALTDAEIAWMAGLFDGEGCISYKHVNCVILKISMTDEDLIKRFHRLADGGNVYFYDKKTYKRMYVWEAGNHNDCRRLLLTMLPWFGERRKTKSLEAIERLRNNAGSGKYSRKKEDGN